MKDGDVFFMTNVSTDMIYALIPTHRVGVMILNYIDRLLDHLGLGRDATLETIIYIVLISVFALTLGWAVRRITLAVARKLVSLRHTDVGAGLLQQKVFLKCSHIIPPLVILAFLPLAFETDNDTLGVIRKGVLIYFLIALGIGINSVLTFMWIHFDAHENTNKHPLRGILNTAHGIVWIIIAIITLSLLMDKSPTALLAGLGVFATALMLIFKDSILGLVAGIQLSQNDMLRVGDWIVVPSTPANGTVEEVTLTTVKVRNWDNTLIMLPPYTLVSTSFQNWRGMSDMGAREIQRSVLIDHTTITTVDDEFISKITAKYPGLKTFVDASKTAPQPQFATGITALNGTVTTNLGLYRAYLTDYLLNHPAISNDFFLMVRLLQANESGTPLQVICFSKIIQWNGYEAVQSQIFEHIAVTAPDFGLTIFNASDGDSMTVYTKSLDNQTAQ